MLSFLRNLPADYFVYRELQITDSYRQRIKGYQKKTPDFVAVAPQVGVIAIEVKDWNLDRNTYIWRDQYEIEVRPNAGLSYYVDNPMAQADRYLHALRALLGRLKVFVTSIVAFPRLSKADFVSRLENVEVLRNPQSRFLLDFDRVLFREALDEHLLHPDRLLRSVVEKHPKFRPARPRLVHRVNETLIPSAFRIGDFTRRQQHKQKIKIITERQQQWIFNLDAGKNYLLDVAGSGKTNALISKAIYIVDQFQDDTLPRILLTTYSKNLERNIKRLFKHKIANASDRQRYQDAITIRCIPNLMEDIVKAILELGTMQRYREPGETEEAYERRLTEDAMSALDSAPERFQYFDYVFVDEIQDFNDDYLYIADGVCKTGQFFFVGDIGQKIYDRDHNLRLIGIVPQRAELKKSYRMFRTPRYVAELATRFILNDPQTRADLEHHGYTEDFKPAGDLETLPEIVQEYDPEAAIVDKLASLIEGTYTPRDVMVIASQTRLPAIERALVGSRFEARRGESNRDIDAVVLVNFTEVKGLEKEIVFVTGLEDLYDPSEAGGVFADRKENHRRRQFARRKAYVALTRPLERLIVYYQKPEHPFISELLEINRELLGNRTGASYGF
jgi:hypothetical protein